MEITVHENCEAHLPEFIALNQRWIEEYFCLEEGDRKLAADPQSVWRKGGWIFTATLGDSVIGCCALFKEEDAVFELARMAVLPAHQKRGVGRLLANTALDKLRAEKAALVKLLTNTKLTAAVALYRSLGFEAVSEGQHPVYSRCNLLMEKRLTGE